MTVRAAIAPSWTSIYSGFLRLIHLMILAVDQQTPLPSCRQNTEETRCLVVGALKYFKVGCIDLVVWSQDNPPRHPESLDFIWSNSSLYYQKKIQENLSEGQELCCWEGSFLLQCLVTCWFVFPVECLEYSECIYSTVLPILVSVCHFPFVVIFSPWWH